MAQSSLTLEEAVTITIVDAQVFPELPVTVTPVSTRLATMEELETILLFDADQDGVVSIQDACPVNPFCSERGDLEDPDGDGYPNWHDGFPQDPTQFLTGNDEIDSRPISDEFTSHVAAYPTPEAVIQAALEENAEKGLYDAEDIISMAEQAGFPTDVVLDWRREFTDFEEEGCRDCFEACRLAHVEACRGAAGGRKKADCVASARSKCRQRCKETCAKEFKGKRKGCRHGSHPRGERCEAGGFGGVFRTFWSWIRSVAGWWAVPPKAAAKLKAVHRRRRGRGKAPTAKGTKQGPRSSGKPSPRKGGKR